MYEPEREPFVFDPSLVRPKSIQFLEFLMESKVDLVISPSMKAVLTKDDYLASLLRLWDFPPDEIKVASSYVNRRDIGHKLKEASPPEYDEAVDGPIWSAVRSRVTSKRRLADFVYDEASLALQGSPILAVHGTVWRIVEFLRRMGCTVGKPVRSHFEEKFEKLRTKGLRKKLLATTLGVAVIYLYGNRQLIPLLGPPVIRVLIEDP